MSNILNIKNLDGDWDSIVAIRGKKGDKGEDGTKFTVEREYVEGDSTVKIATFHTDNNGVTEDVEIFAPTSGGGGSDVSFVEGTQFADSTTVGTLKIAGKGEFPINVPSKVSDFTNDAGYITENDIPPIPEVPTKVSELENDEGYVKAEDIPTVPTKTSDLTNDSGFIAGNVLSDEWASNAGYQKDDIVIHNNQLWKCSSETELGEEPGVSARWQTVTVESLLTKQEEYYTERDSVVIGTIPCYSPNTTAYAYGYVKLDKPLDSSVTGVQISPFGSSMSLIGNGVGTTLSSSSSLSLPIDIEIQQDRSLLRLKITTSVAKYHTYMLNASILTFYGSGIHGF